MTDIVLTALILFNLLRVWDKYQTLSGLKALALRTWVDMRPLLCSVNFIFFI